ncbi:hypothetical protein BC832DRAFT_421109 [Gaertneriomyces semiglobifer]|nr:hypothetical protein BC832DRAFT_421109 [Gaertneriomyces semiglobifer]
MSPLPPPNYKGILQEHFHKLHLPTPTYITSVSLRRNAAGHSEPIFGASVAVHGRLYTGLLCTTRRAAEQDAARKAVEEVVWDQPDRSSQASRPGSGVANHARVRTRAAQKPTLRTLRQPQTTMVSKGRRYSDRIGRRFGGESAVNNKYGRRPSMDSCSTSQDTAAVPRESTMNRSYSDARYDYDRTDQRLHRPNYEAEKKSSGDDQERHGWRAGLTSRFGDRMSPARLDRYEYNSTVVPRMPVRPNGTDNAEARDTNRENRERSWRKASGMVGRIPGRDYRKGSTRKPHPANFRPICAPELTAASDTLPPSSSNAQTRDCMWKNTLKNFEKASTMEFDWEKPLKDERTSEAIHSMERSAPTGGWDVPFFGTSSPGSPASPTFTEATLTNKTQPACDQGAWTTHAHPYMTPISLSSHLPQHANHAHCMDTKQWDSYQREVTDISDAESINYYEQLIDPVERMRITSPDEY